MNTIAVIGAGTMGNGIAHTFAQSGFTVKLIDISEKSLEKGMATIAANLDRMVSKGTITEEDKAKTKLLPAIDRLVSLQLRAMGKYQEDYLIKFNPLSVPSAKDKSETDHRRAQTFQILSDIGALDASEIRAMLPDEGYALDDTELMPEDGEEAPE